MTKKQEEKLQELKEFFGLEKITIKKFSDFGGVGVSIEELGFDCYVREIENAVDDLIDGYNFAFGGVAKMILEELQKLDNQYNTFLNKRTYEIVNVFASKYLIRFGVTIRFTDNGETRNVITTNLDNALRSSTNICDYANRKYHVQYYTAGGIDDEDVDFIFHGVGFSTKVNMYCRQDNEILKKSIA